MAKTWLITGAARGLGLQIARAALAAGDNVVATARNADAVRQALDGNDGRVLAQALDVTDPAAPQRVVDAALARFGRIDVLVNNAGYGHLGIFEESTEEEVRQQLETNVLGLMRMTRAVLPAMRRQRAGHVVNMSSIGGIVPFDSCTLYGMSKFAVEGFSGNLARDVAPFGIRVTAVEPGFFRTDFLDPASVRFTASRIDDYAAAHATETAYRAHSHQQPGDPVKLGQAIVRLVEANEPPTHLALGSDAVGFVGTELRRRLAELERWQALSVSTDHSDLARHAAPGAPSR
ncbi:oxidoreductase [Massilia sp. YMA4]|uniref:oxidoreductase n=1 Tax=Massilia sp. YMA4 TaxID=1593482 RepID=UPI000DD120F9|nr:oxidoreductase [Massilia sp. YMA4]AXA94038.1 short-chain dehydrogenase/reductase [Massilia sp. YMA4]